MAIIYFPLSHSRAVTLFTHVLLFTWCGCLSCLSHGICISCFLVEGGNTRTSTSRHPSQIEGLGLSSLLRGFCACIGCQSRLWTIGNAMCHVDMEFRNKKRMWWADEGKVFLLSVSDSLSLFLLLLLGCVMYLHLVISCFLFLISSLFFLLPGCVVYLHLVMCLLTVPIWG
ncbi:hypothetical protein B0H67DRAFT_275253 [Lasiosphaeris hirsuta]|uniref:Uncharacterized protein n=1 Tax=Lasiosphaeris hirsuta TaxID=260670 RepID=A0AA40A8F5_9PEZI|nr:hypothetical protein B0H67DRAFT_275253 [Lasiosphaeris hirsuta]